MASTATADDPSPRLRFHRMVVDGVSGSGEGGVVFHAVSGLDATAVAQAEQSLRRRLLCGFERCGLLSAADTQTTAHWEHGDGFAIAASARIAAAR